MSLLRLLAILPPALHALAVDARIAPAHGPCGGSALNLADVKDLPHSVATAAIAQFVPHGCRLQSVREFTLTGLVSGCADVGVSFACVLPLMTALTRLNLSRCGIGSEGGSALLRAIADVTELADLDISHNKLRYDSLPVIMAWPGPAHALTSLSLAHNELGAQGVRFMPTALSRMPALARLDMTGVGDSPTDDGAAQLVPPPHLRVLCVSAGDTETYLTSIQQQLPSLTRLSIAYEDTPVLWSKLQAGSQLQELECWAPVLLLPPAAVKLTLLTSLTLAYDTLDSAGDHREWFETLADVLGVTTQLAALRVVPAYLEHVPAPALSLDESTHLARCLRPLVHLTLLELDVALATFDDIFVSGLCKMTSLRHMSLALFALGPPVPEEVSAALPSLTYLHLQGPCSQRAKYCAEQVQAWVKLAPRLEHLAVVGEVQYDHEGSEANVLPLPATLTALELPFHEPYDQMGTLTSSFQRALATLTALRCLKLRKELHVAADVTLLWCAVAQCSLLTCLSLVTGTDVADDAMAAAASQHLPRLPHLRTLKLRGFACHTKAQARGALPSFEAAVMCLTALQELDFIVSTGERLTQVVVHLVTGLPRLCDLSLLLVDVDKRLKFLECHDDRLPGWCAFDGDEVVEAGMTVHQLAAEYGVCLRLNGVFEHGD